MKKTTKRIISILVCLAMTIALIPASFAAGTEAEEDSYAELRASIYQHLEAKDDPYAELKASIFRQLEAQGALQHYELQCAALIPQEGDVMPMSTNNQSWYAPNGGVLSFTYDKTYRGEEGYVDVVSVYMNKSQTDAYLAGQYGTLGDLAAAVVGFVLSPTIIGPILGIVTIGNALQNWLAKQSIEEAGGCARVGTVYDSIDGMTSTVVVGWGDYPNAVLYQSGAYNVSFTYGQP